MRDLGAQIGRGLSLEDAARSALKSNPFDEAEIAQACVMILERNSA
jgi:hypothetical protein